MQHNHEVSNEIAPYYAINRRISAEELKQVADMINIIPNSRELQTFLKERFRRPMTLQDAKNTRQRLRNMQIREGGIESIEVIPSFKEISQSCGEVNGRAILEIKEEREEKIKSEICHPDRVQTSVLADVRQKNHNDASEKMKALSEVAAKFSSLMNSCDTDTFWKRITTMNRVMKCWEVGEDVDVQYISEVFSQADNLGLRQKNKKNSEENIEILVNKVKTSKPDSYVKHVFPVVPGSVENDPKSICDVDPKVTVSHMECKESKEMTGGYIKNNKTHSVGASSECVSYQNNSEVSDADEMQDSDRTTFSEPRVTGNDEGSRADSRDGSPLITFITKEPCLDLSEQAMEVEIEINDEGVTDFKTDLDVSETLC